MRDQNSILLQTKLKRPRLPHDLVVRTRLVELLDHDIDHQIILVCAPAGFGKTTLIGSWLEHLAAGQDGKAASMPSAWLSLDEKDSDLNLFLRYFIAALRTIFSAACEKTLALLQAQQAPPQTVLYATFSNELEALPGECILVLDDYQAIRGNSLHNLLGEMVRHWPRSLHLVLISRISPPIPLDNLRAKGMVSEIRTRDLRFTPEETAAYLNKSKIPFLSQNTLPILEERFEGWPAGLHLATLSMRSAGSQESVLMALSSENTNITGYLVDEVLTHQLPAVQSFLMETSFLDRFCASLCEAVIGKSDAAWNVHACLDWIERSELFLIHLDNRREWYRYHHLFQELLQQRASAEIGPDQVADLHRRASAWFEERGLLDEAIHHALAAGDLDLAAHQMNVGLRDVLNRADRPTLERWLRLLPEEMIQRRPDLLMIRVWTLHFLWQLDLLARVLQQAEALLDSDAGVSVQLEDLKILRGQILTARAQLAYFSNQTTRAIDLCREALALMPPSWTFVRGGAMFYLGMSMQASGQALAAERLLLAEYESYADKTDAYAVRLVLPLCFNYLNTGRLKQARQIAQVLAQGATHSRLAILENWGDYFLGMVAYQRNELQVAEQHFTQILENRYTALVTTWRDAIACLALIHQINGESLAALQLVETVSQYDLEQRGIEDGRTGSLRARLMLLQGNLEGACRWADAFTNLPPDQPLLWLEEPQVTRTRVLLARGTDADLRLALQILEALEEITTRTHNTRHKLEVIALRALVMDAQGETSQADAVLKQAVDLAQPGEFIRVFVDLGRPMQEMLCQLVTQNHSGETIQRILAVFPQHENIQDSLENFAENFAQSKRRPSLGAEILAEHLTHREFEVLNLLRGPASIKEIALTLNISYATAKRHTINLYGKLGVNGRWNAVTRAEELNILPPR